MNLAAALVECLQAACAVLQARSPRWPAARRAHLLKEPACRACGCRSRLNVHHIVPVHVDRSLELDPGNLITLCESPGVNHHLAFGHLGNWKSWNGSVRSDADWYRTKVEGRP